MGTDPLSTSRKELSKEQIAAGMEVLRAWKESDEYDERKMVAAIYSAMGGGELDNANVGLASEVERIRAALENLVAAGDALGNRDDMTAADEEAAQQKWDEAQEAARKFTDAAVMARAVTRSETKRIEIEEGFTYWTHEGHIMRRHYTGSQCDAIEALGPGGWTEVP